MIFREVTHDHASRVNREESIDLPMCNIYMTYPTEITLQPTQSEMDPQFRAK